MFRLEVFVEKKRLADVFERLTGIADIHSCAMVPNAEIKPNGKVYQTSADTRELISKEIYRQKLTELTGPQFRDIIVKLGLNRTSYSHHAQAMVSAGVLKKGKKIANAMQYIVTGK